jgi:hypothetical protein
MKSPLSLVLSATCILAGVAVAFIAYYACQPPVPDAKLRQVKLGMTSEAVRELLGPPTFIHSVTNDVGLGVPGTNWGAQWTYERNLPWRSSWVNVMLTNGSVSYIGRDRFP